MWLRLAALAALALAPCLVTAQQKQTLSLDDAFARVAQTHPELRLLGPRQQVLLAERDQALLRPALRAGAELENALGTGQASGLQGAELTLTLASDAAASWTHVAPWRTGASMRSRSNAKAAGLTCWPKPRVATWRWWPRARNAKSPHTTSPSAVVPWPQPANACKPVHRRNRCC